MRECKFENEMVWKRLLFGLEQNKRTTSISSLQFGIHFPETFSLHFNFNQISRFVVLMVGAPYVRQQPVPTYLTLQLYKKGRTGNKAFNDVVSVSYYTEGTLSHSRNSENICLGC